MIETFKNQIPIIWKTKNLNQVATIKSGKSNAQDAVFGGAYIFFDRSKNEKWSNRYLFDKEAVIVAGEGKTFEPKYYNGKFDLHQRAYAIFDSNELDIKFLRYYMECKKSYFERVAVGSTVKSLRLPMFQNMQIVYPSLTEQKRIVSVLNKVLGDVDGVIAHTQSALEKTQDLFQSALQQKITPEKNDWQIKELGDLLDYEQPTNYVVKSTDYKNDYKIPVLTAGKGFIKGYSNETDGIYNKGKCIIFDDFTTATQFVDFDFKVKSSAMKILSCKTNDDIWFIYSAMQLLDFNAKSHKRYWISEYSKLQIPIPPLSEQKRIVAELDTIKQHITKLDGIYTQKLHKLHDLRQSVLQSAFRGEL